MERVVLDTILEQLEINQTIFIHFGLFCVLFFALSRIYFKPFMNLFEKRHQKTVEDRKTAEALVQKADEKFKDYQEKIHLARKDARQDYEQSVQKARKQEAEILAEAREQAKSITQGAAQEIEKEKNRLQQELQADIESLAKDLSERLLSKK